MYTINTSFITNTHTHIYISSPDQPTPKSMNDQPIVTMLNTVDNMYCFSNTHSMLININYG